MKPLLRIGSVVALLLLLAGATGYLTLKLIVTGEDSVIVPELVGKDVVYALEVLTDLGLNIRVAGSEFRSDVPKNYVAYQEPEAGAEVKKNRDVRIVISKGPQFVAVPNLAGMDVRQASILIEENGLGTGVVSKVFHDSGFAGEVISHSPEAGRMVRRGDKLGLLVSLGKRQKLVEMPHLHGLPLEEAILALERLELNLGRIDYGPVVDEPKDVVIRQEPLSGYPVAVGSLVKLTVNREAIEGRVGGGLYVFHYSAPEGFLKQQIRLRIAIFGFSYDLIDRFVAPTTDLWAVIPEAGEGAVFLYENGEPVISRSLASRPAGGIWMLDAGY